MKSVDPINIIENYVSVETCDFLIRSFKDTFTETENKGIFSGVSIGLEDAWKISPVNTLPSRSSGENNIAIDLFTNILNSISKTISKNYQNEMDYRSIFLSKMVEGSQVHPHFDNHRRISKDSDEVVEHSPYGTKIEVINKIGFQPDYSALLYLNDNYSGGEIEFPSFNLKVRPQAGTLIFFKGDQDVEHLVNKVTDGERINIVSFLWPTEYRIRYFNALESLPELFL